MAGVVLTPFIGMIGFVVGGNGVGWFWFSALLIDGVTLVCLFAIPSWRRMQNHRPFLLGLTFGLLGGLAVCNSFSIRSLFSA